MLRTFILCATLSACADHLAQVMTLPREVKCDGMRHGLDEDDYIDLSDHCARIIDDEYPLRSVADSPYTKNKIKANAALYAYYKTKCRPERSETYLDCQNLNAIGERLNRAPIDLHAMLKQQIENCARERPRAVCELWHAQTDEEAWEAMAPACGDWAWPSCLGMMKKERAASWRPKTTPPSVVLAQLAEQRCEKFPSDCASAYQLRPTETLRRPVLSACRRGDLLACAALTLSPSELKDTLEPACVQRSESLACAMLARYPGSVQSLGKACEKNGQWMACACKTWINHPRDDKPFEEAWRRYGKSSCGSKAPALACALERAGTEIRSVPNPECVKVNNENDYRERDGRYRHMSFYMRETCAWPHWIMKGPGESARSSFLSAVRHLCGPQSNAEQQNFPGFDDELKQGW